MKIGVFDSGLGGLQVLKALQEFVGEYDFFYYGDNLHAPYGEKTQEEIYNLTKSAVEKMFTQHDCKLIILACNTASAEALRRLQQELLPKHYHDRRILGVIRPSVEYLAKLNLFKVGLIATPATVSSAAYVKEMKKLSPLTEVVQISAPKLVPLIEEGLVSGQVLDAALDEYLTPLLEQNVQSIILGCTHYPIIIEQIRRIVPKNIEIFDPSVVVAKSLKNYLQVHADLEKQLSKQGLVSYYFSRLPKMGSLS